MGTALRESYSRLDNLIAEFGPSELIPGDSALIDEICAKVSQGEKPWEIATKHHNIAWMVLRKWIEDEPSRMDALELAHRCFADKLSYQELEEAALATTDDVALRKFRADVWGRKAKQLDRQRYGDKVEVTHKAVPVLNILTVEALVEKVVEGLPVESEVSDASPIDG